ncbi:hypothetical protein [Rhizobium leguminosarum]|uniref:hypothetical protein n=1 Tax=Rhizobium leguminosarum TaxID=384 RepID=UPI0015D9C0C5|nr:hypothetical protein [Rhizobium leguminosarum]NZD50510.1 hypothetical protein [Rhizobium leguminosarum]
MGKFNVDYTFHGRASRTIEADSLEDAKAKIDEEVNRDDFEIEPDDIDDIDFRVTEMHPVTRDGRELWTTYVRAGDVRGHQPALRTSPLFSDKVAA